MNVALHCATRFSAQHSSVLPPLLPSAQSPVELAAGPCVRAAQPTYLSVRHPCLSECRLRSCTHTWTHQVVVVGVLGCFPCSTKQGDAPASLLCVEEQAGVSVPKQITTDMHFQKFTCCAQSRCRTLTSCRCHGNSHNLYTACIVTDLGLAGQSRWAGELGLPIGVEELPITAI